MVNPNVPSLLPVEGIPEALSLAMHEDEMQMHLEQNASDLFEPYGSKEMIDVSPELAIGELACVYGLNSQVDDMPPPAHGSEISLGGYDTDRVDSLY
jgi:hypothetical protein